MHPQYLSITWKSLLIIYFYPYWIPSFVKKNYCKNKVNLLYSWVLNILKTINAKSLIIKSFYEY